MSSNLFAFERTDWDPDNERPVPTTKSVDSKGHVNYYRPVDLDEEICTTWRRKLGKELAKRLSVESE